MTRYTKKTVCFAVCVAILLVAVSALAWATSGFTNWNAKTWFDYWGKGDPAMTVPEYPEKPDAPMPDELDVLETKTYDDVLLTSDPMQAFQLRSGRIAASETTFVLVATVTDDQGESGEQIQAVKWSMEWNGTNFDWTSGTWAENDRDVQGFISMTADGGTATFTLLAPFGTQIKVTCTSSINSSVSATATIDYRARLKTLKAKWGNNSPEQTIFTISDDDSFLLVPLWQEAQNSGVYPTMPGQIEFCNSMSAPGNCVGILAMSGLDYGIGSVSDPVSQTDTYIEISMLSMPTFTPQSRYKKTYSDYQGNMLTDNSLIEIGLMSSVCGSAQALFYSGGSVYEFNNRSQDFLVHLHLVTRSKQVYDIRYYVDVTVPVPNVSSLTIDNPTVIL